MSETGTVETTLQVLEAAMKLIEEISAERDECRKLLARRIELSADELVVTREDWFGLKRTCDSWRTAFTQVNDERNTFTAEVARLTRERDEAHALLAARPAPPAEPSEELVERCAEVACSTWWHTPDSNQEFDDWRNVARAVLAEAAKPAGDGLSDVENLTMSNERFKAVADHLQQTGEAEQDSPPEPAPPAMPGDEELYQSYRDAWWRVAEDGTVDCRAKAGVSAVRAAVSAHYEPQIESLRARVAELEGAIREHWTKAPNVLLSRDCELYKVTGLWKEPE